MHRIKPYRIAAIASILALVAGPTQAASATTINFDLNGVAPVVHTAEGSSSVKVPTIELDFNNMSFKGWNTSPTGNGKSYDEGDTINNSTTLYAQWADGTHIGGGTVDPDPGGGEEPGGGEDPDPDPGGDEGEDPNPAPDPNPDDGNQDEDDKPGQDTNPDSDNDPNHDSNPAPGTITGDVSGGSNNNNSNGTGDTGRQDTALNPGSPTAGFINLTTLSNIKTAAPLAAIASGTLAVLAVLLLTNKQTSKYTTNNHYSLLTKLRSFFTTLTHHKAYLTIASISALAILAGSFYLINTNTNATTDTDSEDWGIYVDDEGVPYEGYVTIVPDGGKEVDKITTWWKGGKQQSGENYRNDSWHYFDSSNSSIMARDKDVTHNASVSLAVTDPDNTVDHDTDYTFRYDQSGNRVYGYQQKGGANFHFNEQTGIMTKGWGTFANGKTTYYSLDNGAGIGGNQEHQLPISNGSSETDWYYFDGEGVPITNAWQTLADGRYVYYLDSGRQAKGNQTVDGVQLFFNDAGVVDNGGWDFVDFPYVERMRQRAVANGSDTDWYITLDCDYPPRDVVFRRVGSTWVAVAGYNAIQGYWREGGSRTIPGLHKVTHKYYESSSGPGRVIGFVENWLGGVVSPETDDSQSIHAGNDANNSGYGTYGCSSLSAAHNQWIYDNVPVGSTVDATGACAGVDGNDIRIQSPYPNSDFNLDNHPYGQD